MKFVILGFMLSLSAIAGEKGNGGDAIVCHNSNGSIKSVTLYDHYEGQTRDGRIIDLGHASLSIEEKLDIALKRIARLDLTRAAKYRTWADEFMNEALFLRDIDLIDIPDTGDGYIPAGCMLKQLVIQKETGLLRPNEKRYTINQDYWDHLSNDGKAGTILHEIILRELVASPSEHANSQVARYLNALFSDTSSVTLTWIKYLQILDKGKVRNTGTPFGGDFTTYHYGSRPRQESDNKLVLISVMNTRNGVKGCPVINLNGVQAKVCLTADSTYGNLFFAEGLSVSVDLQTKLKAASLENNWTANYYGHVLLDSERIQDFYQILGSSGFYLLSHPELLPNGCALRPANSGEDHIRPYPSSGVYYFLPPNSLLNLKRLCDLDSLLVVNGVSVRGAIRFINSQGLVELIGSARDFKFPQQTISGFAKIQLAANEAHRFASLTTYGGQKLKRTNNKTITVPGGSVLTVTADGLIKTCTTSSGRVCR